MKILMPSIIYSVWQNLHSINSARHCECGKGQGEKNVEVPSLPSVDWVLVADMDQAGVYTIKILNHNQFEQT